MQLLTSRSMKLLHTADIHLGMENYGSLDPSTGLSTRLGDFLRAFDIMVEKALSEPVDFFIFSGDAFKTREPTQTQQREFARRIKKLSDANIPVIITIGNHDTSNAMGKANSLDIYDTVQMPNVHVLRELEKIEVGGLQIVAYPWLSRAQFEGSGDIFRDLLDSLDPLKPAIAMVHASISGAEFGSERMVMLGGDLVVDKDLLNHKHLTYVALGHIHKRQVLPNTKIPMVYPGSIERIDFGESKEDKGFELVEIKKQTSGWVATHEHFSTNPRPFITIRAKITNLTIDPTGEILKQIRKHNIKNAVVRITADFQPEAPTDIDSTKIREALKEAFHVAPISRNMERVSREVLGESVEELSPLQALEKYFQAKKISPEHGRKLHLLARGLLHDSD